jgi:hypothetical protein
MSGKRSIKVVYLADLDAKVGQKLAHRGKVVGQIVKTDRLGDYSRVFAELYDDLPIKELHKFDPTLVSAS